MLATLQYISIISREEIYSLNSRWVVFHAGFSACCMWINYAGGIERVVAEFLQGSSPGFG